MRHLDIQKREAEVLDLIVESYIDESRPVSSSHLCEKHRLPYSSATIRNIMGSLEKQGLLSHIHTSSGRVPTKQAFKQYAERFEQQEAQAERRHQEIATLDSVQDAEELFTTALEALSVLSGYTSLMGIKGFQEHFSFRGIRFIFDQPEFEDIEKVRNLFYALEVKINTLQDLLLTCVDEELKIFVGDEIGFEEISDCSLLVSGLHEKNYSLALALLGPMRMNYAKASASLYAVRSSMEGTIRRLL